MSPTGHLLFDPKKSLVLVLTLIVVVQIGAHQVSKRETLEDVLQFGPKMSPREAKEAVVPSSWWDPNDDVENFAGLKRSSKKIAAYLRYGKSSEIQATPCFFIIYGYYSRLFMDVEKDNGADSVRQVMLLNYETFKMVLNFSFFFYFN